MAGRWLRIAPALAWAAAIFFLSHQSRLPEPPVSFAGIDKVIHALAYGVGAVALLFGTGWPRGRGAWWVAVVVAAYGVTDELHQSFVVGRSADLLDWVADAAGALLCVALWLRIGGPKE